MMKNKQPRLNTDVAIKQNRKEEIEQRRFVIQVKWKLHKQYNVENIINVAHSSIVLAHDECCCISIYQV